VLLRDGTQVGTVFEAALVGQRGDVVLCAMAWETLFLGAVGLQGLEGGRVLCQVAQGRTGARTPSSAAIAARALAAGGRASEDVPAGKFVGPRG
jgi:hypothetical protein